MFCILFRNFQVIINFLILASSIHSWASLPDTIFARYFAMSQQFADAYPREKAHLHFDNTSYYIGDTIWFKSYVVTAEDNLPTNISTPLYVELLGQLGNVVDKQIVRLHHGEGHGQFILNNTFFSGYYEIRAYTKWMLAFDEKQYFSRTFPVYRKKYSPSDDGRSITTYRMDDSMKQRPYTKKKKFTLRFFPEGGQLVQGLPSLVAFKAESDEGAVSVTGTVRSKDGRQLATIATAHDGMGRFNYTPMEKSAVAEVFYQGKQYTFPLPEVLPLGYNLNVLNCDDGLDIKVTRNSEGLNDGLALFISSQGRPLTYGTVHFNNKLGCKMHIPRDILSDGVIQVSLINEAGSTLCERFCYVMPDEEFQLKGTSAASFYRPYAPVSYRLSLKDVSGNPVKGHFSVALHDLLNSDYREYDDNIYTSLLLTSDLKGYIHQPGYYFAEHSEERKAELDILMMIHGWRKYDMSQIIGTASFTPYYEPEQSLILHGQIRSMAFSKEQKYIGVSVFAKTDTTSVVGMTTADSIGCFSIPVDAFEGTAEALIQTRREGKKKNRLTSVCLFRNFEPSLREYAYEEMHPVWKDMNSIRWKANREDSLYMDSLMRHETYMLDQVSVKARRKRLKNIQTLEQAVLAYYDIPNELDRLRDSDKPLSNFIDMMEMINPDMRRLPSNITGDDYVNVTYKNYPVVYIVNGEICTSRKRESLIDDDVDAIRTVMLCDGTTTAGWSGSDVEEVNLFFTDKTMIRKYLNEEVLAYGSTPNEAEVSNYDYMKEKGINVELPVICYITTVENWRPERRHYTRGIRYTRIQGYNRPLEFYSPSYTQVEPNYSGDYRRTLYWNPDVVTDENGEAVIHCYNAGNATYLSVSAETICNGKPVYLKTQATEVLTE